MRVLLTGASTGIGKAILTTLCANGHTTTVVGRHQLETPHSHFIACDLSKKSEVQELYEAIRSGQHAFDALINNAGGALPTRFEDLEIEESERCMMLNYHAPLLLTQAVLPHMVGQRLGRVINISSISGRRGTPFLYAYSAAKAALNSLTQSLSRTYSRQGISFNAICPGGVETEMSRAGRQRISELMGLESGAYEQRMQEAMGLGNLISPTAVASLVAFLLNSNNAALTGQCINVCGNLELS